MISLSSAHFQTPRPLENGPTSASTVPSSKELMPLKVPSWMQCHYLVLIRVWNWRITVNKIDTKMFSTQFRSTTIIISIRHNSIHCKQTENSQLHMHDKRLKSVWFIIKWKWIVCPVFYILYHIYVSSLRLLFSLSLLCLDCHHLFLWFYLYICFLPRCDWSSQKVYFYMLIMFFSQYIDL